jgi:hypothetical protein
MANPDSVTIISPRRKLVGLAVFCLLVTILGAVVFALGPTQTLNLIVGVAAVGFFGVGGGYALVSQWRKSVVLRADDDGIHLGGGRDIPWTDVDRIGSNASTFGIRLRRYDSLASFPRSSDVTVETMRASRREPGGWDISWPARLLDRSPSEAARDVQRRRPA